MCVRGTIHVGSNSLEGLLCWPLSGSGAKTQFYNFQNTPGVEKLTFRVAHLWTRHWSVTYSINTHLFEMYGS